MSKVIIVPSSPFEGQKPGTSGLRKPVQTFQQSRYTENFIQSIIDIVLKGQSSSGQVTLVVGGDGRYHSKVAIDAIVAIAAANGIGKLIIAQNGIMSTPAVSSVIRALKATGGIILTASHNPGGPNGDFGIKYNCDNGGPAPDHVTNEIYEQTKSITQYKILEPSSSLVDISQLGNQEVSFDGGKMIVEIVDGVEIYLKLLKTIFDFGLLKEFVSKKKILIDAMNGVMGPYVKRIIVKELGAPESSAIRCVPLEDFGNAHPDPNLTYAADLVKRMKNEDFDFGAAFDGDGDRNMILGAKGFFVTPSDSLAVLAEKLEVIPYFQREGVKGYARSMPTSRAIDLVGAAKNISVYETPTGWKYFGNLMDAGKVSICGEESFGTGSDHIREKDGLWAVLAWLSVLAKTGSSSVEALVKDHWKKFGRYFYSRYDYENCDATACNSMMSAIKAKLTNGQFIGTTLIAKTTGQQFTVNDAFDYAYTNHLTGIKEHGGGHGLVILFDNSTARAIYRLSGTGSQGATVRVYLEQFMKNGDEACNMTSEEALSSLAEVALTLAQLKEFTGRETPTVIT